MAGDVHVSVLPDKCNVVTPKQFDELFKSESCTVDLQTESEKAAYAKKDALLIFLIQREAERQFGVREKDLPHIGRDWWPNHTRYIDMTTTHCTKAFILSLRALLTEEYKNYRIQVCVYGDVMDGKSYVGSMALYSDRVLIEQKLHEFVQSII